MQGFIELKKRQIVFDNEYNKTTKMHYFLAFFSELKTNISSKRFQQMSMNTGYLTEE